MMKEKEKTKDLDDLEIGTPVAIQNQTGNNPNKWDETGIVLENKPSSQVLFRVDRSRRVTMRNRRFVRRLEPTLRSFPPYEFGLGLFKIAWFFTETSHNLVEATSFILKHPSYREAYTVKNFAN